MSEAPSVENEPQPHSEVWVHGGTRLDRKGVKTHAWVHVLDGEEMLFPRDGSFAVGGEYTVKVVRHNDGHATLYGNPSFLRVHDDRKRRERLEAAHKAAEITWSAAARERAAKRASALDDAMAPLIRAAESVPPSQRDAFLALVIRKLVKQW